MKNPIVMIIIALVIAGAAFYGGMQYSQSQRRSFGAQAGFRQGGSGASGRTGQVGQNRPVYGDILSSDDKSITVKLADGSSKIVIVSDSSTINKAEAATKADLKVGEKVAVFGMTNSDGSVTAQSVQLNPTIRVGGGVGGGTPRP